MLQGGNTRLWVLDRRCCCLTRGDHLRDADTLVGRTRQCQPVVARDQSPDGRHTVSMAYRVLRHGSQPAVDLHDLWTAADTQNLSQLREDEWHEPLVLERRRCGVEGPAHERSYEHRAGWGAARKLLARKTGGEHASALAARHDEPGRIEWMGHVVTGEPE